MYLGVTDHLSAAKGVIHLFLKEKEEEETKPITVLPSQPFAITPVHAKSNNGNLFFFFTQNAIEILLDDERACSDFRFN